ncbi:PTS sugar transporter subunit IIC [Enterococcus sp. OL5]|uniref:PTS sugar transporter subunit IIC n=1 Tax=Enterococcus sp. OL5 TaxID=2590214 RepID=UPI00112A1DB0|nr:PTS transporter subunit EIIC [Enterococcus sp. OL5]TPR55132.1 PTS sugar transporter subunit IIC [Enterococcus sp. OL5]
MDNSAVQFKIQKIASTIHENRYIDAVTKGLMGILPVTIIGAIGSLLNALPIEAYQDFLVSTNLKQITSIPAEVATNLISLYAVFLIAYKFVSSYEFDGVSAGILSLLSFLIVTPYGFDIEAQTYAIQNIPTVWLGGLGLFTAIIVSLSSAKIYVSIVNKGWVIKMPDGVPPTISKSFVALIPGFILSFLWLFVRFSFSLTNFESIHRLIYSLISAPLTSLGGTFAAMFIAMFLIQFLWIFGVHGPLIVLSILLPIWTPLGTENIAAYNSGAEIPNIISGALSAQILFMGSGATLGLAIIMIRAKSEQYRTLGKLAIIPNMFGINEPIIFGLPIIMNLALAIPFILTPLIIFILAYLGMFSGVLPMLPGFSAPLGTPVILSGFISGGWR